MTVAGPLLARGRTSEVFTFGLDAVVKVPRPEVPKHWARLEAELSAAVHNACVITPEVRDVIVIDGRDSIVFERVDGPSMWQLMVEQPTRLPELTEQLVSIQREINQVRAPDAVPGLLHRICSKIAEAGELSEGERRAAVAIASGLPSGSELCHGDLHPGNILMGSGGPVVIDWFDAAAGNRSADLVRSSLLIRPPVGGSGPVHLPGASPSMLAELHRRYLRCALSDCGAASEELLLWERVLAASRLAEHIGDDHARLLALWRSGEAGSARTELAEALASIGFS